MPPSNVSFGPDAVATERLRREFAANGRVRIEGLLGDVEATHIRRSLGEDAPWWRTFNQGAKSWDLGPESLAVLDEPKTAQIEAAVHDGARAGFQYFYDTIRVAEEAAERAARDLVVDRLVELFNSPAALDFWRRLTGNPAVQMVDGQATRYLPGHFLTRHSDHAEGKNRIAAYVYGLSPRWLPEWGGLLLFHAPDGTVRDGFVPRFDTLNLFNVPQDHSVSVVAPFAPEPRLSVTGWIRLGDEATDRRI